MAQHPENPQLDRTTLSETDVTYTQARTQARKRIEKRQGLQASLVAYVVINAFLVGIWALSGGGYFWPAWVMAAWGVGVVFQVWDYLRRPVTEADVDAEVRRMQRR